ncbi:MAG: hypothetical protein A2283_09550 [Lentisphaerae bacterium RIFOXYA12_FULL_48_11]|nr:MAG: hypothetical protein A2283_09550 [Lentisphaerae bacterium RIFOXYA12_FULL_48_11]
MESLEISSLSSEELADKARAGSVECFAELVRRHYGSLFRFLYRRVSNRHDAEDLSQETFARAYRKIDQYQSRYKFATWLFTIGWRLSCTFHRSRVLTVELPEEGVSGEVVDHPFVIADDSVNLWNKIEKILPESQHSVLWHKYGEGLSISEIADKTGRSEVHVKVLLHRARTKLAKSFCGNMQIGGGK